MYFHEIVKSLHHYRFPYVPQLVKKSLSISIQGETIFDKKSFSSFIEKEILALWFPECFFETFNAKLDINLKYLTFTQQVQMKK